jgi:hypothetical protein
VKAAALVAPEEIAAKKFAQSAPPCPPPPGGGGLNCLCLPYLANCNACKYMKTSKLQANICKQKTYSPITRKNLGSCPRFSFSIAGTSISGVSRVVSRKVFIINSILFVKQGLGFSSVATRSEVNIPGAKARSVARLDARAEARAYLRSKFSCPSILSRPSKSSPFP